MIKNKREDIGFLCAFSSLFSSNGRRCGVGAAHEEAIAPLATDFDVGLIDADGAAMWFAELPRPFLAQRRIGQCPTIHGAMIDGEAAFKEHFFNVPIAQRIARIQGDGLDGQPGFEKVARLKASFD
jgi:hypothetical protein